MLAKGRGQHSLLYQLNETFNFTINPLGGLCGERETRMRGS